VIRPVRSYLLMVRWQMLSRKTLLVLTLILETLVAVGFTIGLGFLFPDIGSEQATYLITGVPVLSLLMVGFVLVPQMVAQAKMEGTFDYIWSLPVPRMVYLLADATVWLLLCLPGIAVALLIGPFYYHFTLHFDPRIIAVFILTPLTATFVGYTIAHLSPRPELTMLLGNLLAFFVLIFSPIYYPIEQLPGWLAAVHRVLPMKYMADLVRGTLTDTDVNLGLAFGVVAAWAVAGFVITTLAVRRRR
jgi:ABC-2 type transport system permease protein